MYAVGVYGFSWSSSAAGSGASRIGFLSNGITPNSSNGRAHAFQLRCLQE
ncbi:MAG: hypothetical protein K2K83_06885 [Rikenella sp.]|nr:hypothetical protein [Rikenella sp.]